MAAPTVQCSYEDIEPYCKWKSEEGCDAVELHLHGFTKEQLRIQLNNLGVMTITGERPVSLSKSIRFCKQIKVSKDCKTDGVRAKMSAGILNIIMPKNAPLIPSHQHQPPSTIPQQNQEKDKMVKSNAHPHNVTNAAQNKEFSGGQSGTNVATTSPRHTLGSKAAGWKLEMSGKMAVSVAIVVAVTVAVGAYIAYKWDRQSRFGPTS